MEPPVPYLPPPGSDYGWQDPARWGKGWDDWFYDQDPNHGDNQPSIDREAHSIADKLGANMTQEAADQLEYDLYRLRGDIYAQDSLLNETSKLAAQNPNGEQLQLAQWDPNKGTWANIEITSADNQPLQDIHTFRPNDRMTQFGESFTNDRGQIERYTSVDGDSFWFWYDDQGKVNQAVKIPSGGNESSQTSYAREQGTSWTVQGPGGTQSVDLGAGGMTVDANGPHLPSVPNSVNDAIGIPKTPRARG